MDYTANTFHKFGLHIKYKYFYCNLYENNNQVTDNNNNIV